MRDILVHAAGIEPWSESVRYAGMLASWMHASLTALHCPPANPPLAIAGGGPAAAGAPSAPDALEFAWAKQEAFSAYASSLGVRHSEWVVHDDGCVVAALTHLAQWHDLLVLGHDGMTAHPEMDLGRLQLVEHVPCMIVPQAWTTLSCPARAALVWDGSLSSVRALHAAVALLERVGRVVLLMGGKHGSLSLAPGLPPFDLDRYCERHELETGHVALGEDWTGEGIVQAALAANVDLLVMGAHGRTRMSNRLLDQDTQHVLRHLQVPLLLCH